MIPYLFEEQLVLNINYLLEKTYLEEWQVETKLPFQKPGKNSTKEAYL